MKKILTIALIAVLAVALLTSCAAPAAPSAAPASEAPAAASEAPASAAPAATEAPASEAPAADAAASEAPAAAGNGKTAADITVGFSVHFKQDDYGVICSEGFQEVCDAAGVKCEILDANGDPAKQLADIESFIAKKYDAIAISPMDESALIDVCKKANEAGIPLISITTMPDATVATTVNAGNYEFSEEVATILADLMGGKGKVAILDIPTSLWRTQQRLQAFKDVIATTDIEIVAEEKKGTVDEGVDAASTIMTANPGLNAIWGTYSSVLQGAGQAAKTAGVKDLVIGGVDCDAAILQLMKEGYVQAAAAQFPRAHGEESAKAAIAWALGEGYPEVVDVPYKVYTADQYATASMEVWGKEME